MLANCPSSQALPQIGFKTQMDGKTFVKNGNFSFTKYFQNISFTEKETKMQKDVKT